MFAQMAWLEAASVPAFERLERELECLGAPKRLRDASRRAARDEVRHARAMRAHATRAGAVVPAAEVDPVREARALEEIAIENAVEGCVRETFGAAVAALQAARAGDVSLRRTMRVIARDEARHAELAWEIAAWADERLDHAARARVREARARAIADLTREMASGPDPDTVAALGVPTAAEAQAMLESLGGTLWAAA
jgi:hypothetical protein